MTADELKHARVAFVANGVVRIPAALSGAQYDAAERLFDWSIANPDGSMEGNIVGKFLEGYQP